MRCRLSTGVGIPEDEIPRISECFYQVDKSLEKPGFRGTGLGLSIVKGWIHAYGGKIDFTIELGRGSFFRV